MKKGFFMSIMIFSLLMIAAAAFADQEYDAALKEYYRGHYKDAAVRLKAYVEKKPDPVAYYLIGYSLYKLGRFREATEYFNEAYLIDPNFSPEKHGLGKKLPNVKARVQRKKAVGHARAPQNQAEKEKRKTTIKKVSPSSCGKTEQKRPR